MLSLGGGTGLKLSDSLGESDIFHEAVCAKGSPRGGFYSWQSCALSALAHSTQFQRHIVLRACPREMHAALWSQFAESLNRPLGIWLI